MESSGPLIDDLPGSPTLLKKSQSLNGREEATNSENILEEEEDEKGSEKETDDEATDLEYNRVERPVSPVSSVLSMQTSHSYHHDPPNFRTQPMESSDRYQPCDVCSDGRVRAVKSCLTCSALYCEVHIRDHYTEVELQEHKLVDITDNLYCQQEEAKHFSVSVETEQGETQSSETDAQALHQNSWKQEWKTGRRPARKSATGNTVLGKGEFNGGFSPVSGTSECEAHSAEEERRMEETEEIEAENKRKREQAERKIREEKNKKRMEGLMEVQTSITKMRYKVQQSFVKKFFKLPDPGMLNLQDAENMLEESEKQIKAWQEMQMEELERRIRAEMEKQWEELKRQIREEEREKRQELEQRLRAEMEKQREELERKIREEEREKRQELEQRLRAEMEKWREELERKIRKE